ncbi:MAG: sigma-70 family RNA polymerase sigma factor [Tepidimonas sp.]|uniref:sigma-70 family RNA polymerase sigma factor n=1 Tax=Tepidimonas sp. TaxID=2002775 RepID=UPI00259D77C2|nr:sigma-70 family RNA polymerase sigma factor [Tepidimonas sp.]MDM7455844.1 sigma-70 family RNA polymerase sigma factor [Tepidimonas sp.]
MQEPSDATLVAQAQAELPYRTAAFEALMQRYGARIRQLARRFAASDADAEDLAQEVMLKVFFELPRFRAEAAFTTWLWRVTANVCFDYQRRLDARPASVPLDDEDTPEPIDPRDPIAAVQASVDAQRLLRQLTPEDRLVVLLRLLVGLEFTEIAAATGHGLSAVKMRYVRALEKLRATSMANDAARVT